MRKIILASSIGTIIEWYDFFIYGTAAALVFNKLFFPQFDPLTGTLAALGTYAVGFFARPIGGILFGSMGDKVGRKSTLIITLSMMGLCTFLIGVLPPYAMIGIAAPILLLLLRFIQGLAVGGEVGGAWLMVSEHGQAHRRGYLTGWVGSAAVLGLIVANTIFSIFAALPEKEFLAWGWRVPFLIGIFLTLVGYFIRARIAETPLFEKAKATRPPIKNPAWHALRYHWREILLSMGLKMGENGAFYILSVFVLTYATVQLGIAKSIVLNGVMLGCFFEFLSIPLLGALSDKIGRRPVSIFGAVFLMLFILPFFWMMGTHVTWLIWLAIVLAMAIGHGAMFAPQGAMFTELFGTNVRYSGMSLGYQLATPLGGGLAPLICVALLKYGGGDPFWVCCYIVVMMTISALSMYIMKETHKVDIDK